MKKTLLFHVNYFLAGGIEKVLIELLRALDPEKYRIKLSIGYNFGEKEILKKDIPSYVEIHYLLNSNFLVSTQKKKHTGKVTVLEKGITELIVPPIRKMVMRRALTKLIQDVDTIIDFDTTLSPFNDLFVHINRVAYCHFSFVHIWSGSKAKADKLAKRLNKYSKVVMLCDEMKEETGSHYPFLSNKLVRIYNALDKNKILQKAGEPIEEARLAGHEYVVSVGRLNETQKDFTTLIKAYVKCVKTYGTKEYLVIVGSGGDEEQLKQLAADAGMTDRILFTGFQQNPYKWISKAKLFLFSSRYEGLPTVLIEAMLLGKPLVATACPTGVKELLMYGDAGILTEIGNVQQMADALNELLGNKQKQEGFEAHRAAFLEQFDAGYMVREFERKLLNS